MFCQCRALLLRTSTNPTGTLNSKREKKAEEEKNARKRSGGDSCFCYVHPRKEAIVSDGLWNHPFESAASQACPESALQTAMPLFTVCFVTTHLLVTQDREGGGVSGTNFIFVLSITSIHSFIHLVIQSLTKALSEHLYDVKYKPGV